MEKNKNDIYVISVEDTKKYGIIKAAIIGRVRWWCKYNQDNKVKDKYHNGKWWCGFMSAREFGEQLGVSKRTIEKHLPDLVKDNILIKDKFNKKGFDKTCWYRINDVPNVGTSSTQIEYDVYPNRVNDIPKMGTSSTQIGYMDIPELGIPIPVNLSVNQNVKQDVGQSASIPVNPETTFPSVEDKLKRKHTLKLEIKDKFKSVHNIDKILKNEDWDALERLDKYNFNKNYQIIAEYQATKI